MSNRHSGMSEEQRAHILQNERKALERVFRRLANFDKKKDFLKQVVNCNALLLSVEVDDSLYSIFLFRLKH